MKTDETAQLEHLKAQQPETFELLVSRYSRRLLGTAARICTAEDAEDVVQDSLLAAWRSIHQFQGTANLYTWLHRIVVNRSLARLRTAQRRGEVRETDLLSGLSIDSTAWAEEDIPLEEQVAMRITIANVLRKIPEDLRIVLLLRDVEEMSSQETAAQLGISDALVRQRLHRARTAMAELLRPELCGGSRLTCGGGLEWLFDHLDGCLAEEFRSPVERHLQECVICGSLLSIYRASIRFPRILLREETPRLELSAKRIQERASLPAP